MKITLLTGKTFDIEKSFDFPIKVIKSTSARRITLRIDSKDRIPVLSIPKICSAKKAIEFVKKHQNWIEIQLKKIPESTKFSNNTSFSFMGKDVSIKHDENLKSGTFINDGILFVSGKEEFLNRRVKDFIREQTKKELTEISRKKASKIGCKINSIAIKDTKSRWGSCSSNNNINYSWRIALAPDFVIDYLVSHEVAHLKHQDHSKDFWACVKSLCSRCLEGKTWLKIHGKELYLYE